MLNLIGFGVMAKKLDGKQLAKEIEFKLKLEIDSGIEKGLRPPGLAVIRVGDDPASGVYVANKEKACSRIGVDSYGVHLSGTSSTADVMIKIRDLNLNENVDGILLQLPLPKHIDETLLLKAISPDKDADGLHTENLGKLIKGELGPRSCTPAAVMALLRRFEIPIESKRAVVIGRSILVGKPMALMLQAANATVTVAHSKTKNLIDLTRQAELLVVAAGQPQMIGAEHISSDSVVIDVGIHRINSVPANHNGSRYKLCGDVRFDEVSSKASAVTPVPGGVGPMTVAMLLVNTVSSWQQHCSLSTNIGELLR